jgi:hypothetical protein
VKHASRWMLAYMLSVSAVQLHAQPPSTRASPPLTAKAAAPIDLTGYWVSVVSEDWRWRMVTPLRNDFANIP